MERTMTQIEHVVMLMLENRSFDNVLGWLYEKDSPKNYFPVSNLDRFAGLAGTESNPLRDKNGVMSNHLVTRVDNPAGVNFAVPDVDPNEEFEGVRNQLFGDTKPVDHEPTPDVIPRMKGFLQDYYGRGYLESVDDALRIMQCFGPEQLPTLNGIAKQFAVSDAWFSSVPSQTDPNRAFSLCGTSLGKKNNAGPIDTPTIFNALSDAGASWGLYWQPDWLYPNQSYTEYTFPQLKKGHGKHEIAKIEHLIKRILNDDLLDFTYIEPKWGLGETYNLSTPGNDYHPPTSVSDGENFLYAIIGLLMLSKCWNTTLLIITFDEHGGTYDHVPPRWHATPDGLGPKSDFAFNRFGVRVPTILASPFVRPGMVFRAPGKVPYDHTSFIKTLLRWRGVDPKTAGFGDRMKAAPSFDEVLSDTKVNIQYGSPDVDFFLEHILPLDLRNGKAMLQAMREGSALPPIEGPLNETMRDVPAGVARWIFKEAGANLERIEQLVEEYRRDPEAFVVGRIGAEPRR